MRYRVLVTGGAGFIGSNLVETLVDKNYEVRVLDNFSLGTKRNLKKVEREVEIIVGDITDIKTVNKVLRDMDYVFHQAAASSAPMYEPDPRDAVRATLNGFINVLKAAKENGVKRVIYASSSSLYGNSPIPHTEDMKIEPISFYVTSKLAVEYFAKIYSRYFGLETVGLRYFSVYGPHEKAKGKYANVLSQFLWKMRGGKRPVIYGDGTQTRDFTYVEDVVQANLLAMKRKNINGEIFNVGRGERRSFNEIVEILNEALGTSIEPVYVPNPLNSYVKHTLADISKIRTILGYEPKIDLREGIERIKDLE
ncbi:MAG: NAD-dependent epimerase/dehydratase family protein [Candidatus Methanofastidiosia archaeon]